MGFWKKFRAAIRCSSKKKEEKLDGDYDFPDENMLNRIQIVNAFRACFLELENELVDKLKEGIRNEPMKYMNAHYVLLQAKKKLKKNFKKILANEIDSLDGNLFKITEIYEWNVLDKNTKKVVVRWINYANMITKAIYQLKKDLCEEFPKYAFMLSLLLTYEIE